MAFDFLLMLLAAATIIFGLALFIQRKLMHSVIFLALAATASAFIFLYLGQVLVAMLQLLIFVGGLSTYLIVAIATEERHVKMSNAAAFFAVSLVIAVGLFYSVFNLQEGAHAGNSFSTVAQGAMSQYYALLFAAIFLVFAVSIGSVVVIKRFAKLVV